MHRQTEKADDTEVFAIPGLDVDSEEVLAALGAKRQELDLTQIAAGVKETVGSGETGTRVEI
jgi:hypothetical protein